MAPPGAARNALTIAGRGTRVLPRDVGQQRHLARPLHRDRDLTLVPAARARDAAVADLALLRDVKPGLGEVLVVDFLDLLLAEVTALPPAARRGPRGSPAGGAFLRLSHSVPS